MPRKRPGNTRCLSTTTLAILLILGALGAVRPVHATTVIPPDFPTLVNDCDYIVHATVKNVTCERQTGAYGVRIMTHVELAVIEVIAGHPPAAITLDLLGGQIGRDRMMIVGMPQFTVGDEDILFVSGNGKTLCPLNRMMHGRYPILSDAAGRKYVARADHTPLRATADVQLPLGEKAVGPMPQSLPTANGALTPDDFVQQIKVAIQPGSRLQRAP